MWLNVDTSNLKMDVLPADVQVMIRQAICDDDGETVARWLDERLQHPTERLAGLLLACRLASAVSAAEQTLTEEYGRWLDSLPSEPIELCECGLPLDRNGYPHDDCRCCGDCGHYPCECGTQHEDDDCDCCEATEAKYDRADYRYEER